MNKQRSIRSAVLAIAALCAGVPPSSAQPSRQSVRDLAEKYGFPDVFIRGEQVTLKSPYATMVLAGSTRRMTFNSMLIWMNDTLTRNDGAWTVSQCDAEKVMDPLLRPRRTARRADDVAMVVLDPGHGGDDSGAVGFRKLYEKKAVLDIAKRVKKMLHEAGVTAVLTREKDVAIPLAMRSSVAKSAGADLFVSIHLNSSPSRGACGLETYALTCAGYTSTTPGRSDLRPCPGNRFDAENMLLAYLIHRGLIAHAEMADRGIKRARFDVLQEAPCPAALVECGFVSSAGEASRLIRDDFRDALAEGITAGITTYVGLTRRGS